MWLLHILTDKYCGDVADERVILFLAVSGSVSLKYLQKYIAFFSSNKSLVMCDLILIAGPTAWNSLLPDIRIARSLTAFKNPLKTHLFIKSY